ncbi:hypothetical protein [Streptomyces scopuliridis]|uniref:hypothetical protein n=2 Tax=Streptomyces scopuliridis TaxID=452529 RepID=UPI0036CDC1DE
MNPDALRFASFAQLGEAVTDWTAMIGKLEKLRTEAETGLRQRAQKADWAGYNATVTREFITKTAREFADAVTQATSIRNILQDTRAELIGYQGQLKDAIARGAAKNLTVTSTDGGFTVTMNIHPDRAAKGTEVPEHTPQDVTDLRDEVERILKAATTSDTTAGTVLRALVDGTDTGFSGGKPYKDRDQAAQKIAEADEAAKIYAKGSDATNTELASLNTYLKRNQNDPLFAERFAKDVGPKKMVELYANFADDSQFYVSPRSRTGLSPEQKERMKLLGALEQGLGGTLATATRSDSADMDTWKRQLLAEGPKDINGPGQNRVYGYQVMSNLMRYGTYDQKFLNDYGTDLMAFEKKNTTDEYGGLQRRVSREDVLPWDRSGSYERLHYGDDDDGGRDPMVGFMEALGHNSEASTEFLDSDANFDYLTQDRDWMQDQVSEKAKGIAGHDSLGHALESATKGSAYDANPPVLHRDADTASVAERVIERYGQPAEGTDEKRTQASGSELMKKQAGIEDSLARIGAAYVDDLNWGLDGSEDDRSLFADPLHGGGRTVEERARFDTGDTKRFLGTLGQNEDAYKIMGSAQQVYTTSMLDANPPVIEPNGDVSATDAETAIMKGAEVQGILDRAWGDQLTADGAKAEADYNASVDARTERDKAIIGAITGTAFSFVPEPASGAAAVVVPIVTGQVEDQLTSQIESNLDAYGESQHRNLADVRQGKVSAIYDAGVQSSWQPGRSVLEGFDPDRRYPDEYRELKQAFQTAQTTGYASGSQAQEFGGNLPVTE